MRINYFAFFLLSLLFPPLAYADTLSDEECIPASCSVPSVQIGNDQVDLVCVRYDFPEPGQSSWFYTIQSGTRPAISHVVFALNFSCMEVVESGTWIASPDDRQPGEGDPEIRTNPDPTTGITGLKFDLGFEDGELRNYYFVLHGNLQVSADFSVAVKGGNGFDMGSLCGPSEDCAEVQECAGVCEAPSEITAGPVAPPPGLRDADPGNFLTAAEVTWQANACVTGWRVCRQNQWTGEMVCVKTTTNSVIFDQLIPGTPYLFAVKALCADEVRSVWSEMFAYTPPVLRQSGPAVPDWEYFPNPASSQLQVSWIAGTGQIEILLQDVTGALHASYSLRSNGDAGQQLVNTSQLAEGLYLLTIVRDGVSETRQVAIQH